MTKKRTIKKNQKNNQPKQKYRKKIKEPTEQKVSVSVKEPPVKVEEVFMKTRSQQYSEIVFGHIHQLKSEPKDEKFNKRYGSLCHNFPIMVLRSGLAQAVAFTLVKSKSKHSSPEWTFLQHLAAVTSPATPTPDAFQESVHQMGLLEYQRTTRIILAASIWYKRFAESVLGVEQGNSNEDSHNNEGAGND